MPLFVVPDSNHEDAAPVREFNPCHNPAGTPQGGQFCGETQDAFGPMQKTGWSGRDRRVADIATRMEKNFRMKTAWPYDFHEEVEKRIELWTKTSGDSNPDAVRLQLAAIEEFGLDGVATDHLMKIGDQHKSPSWQRAYQLDREFLRAEYENTQAWFAERGITRVEVFRGQRTGLPATRRGSLRVSMQPASSWTLARSDAYEFAAGREGRLLVSTVPVSRILSTAVTGRGSFKESEVILLGGPIDVTLGREFQ